jgi:hypothetical protein
MHILYFVIVLLYFIYFTYTVLYQKPKKIRILGSCFYLFAFSFVKMSSPEVEVCSFKQQGGESLKDAWYRINNAHHCRRGETTYAMGWLKWGPN